MEYYITVLKAKYAEKQKDDPFFSLKRYARFLNVDASFLSKVINRKNELSLKAALNIAKTLELGVEEETRFLLSVFLSQSIRQMQKQGIGDEEKKAVVDNFERLLQSQQVVKPHGTSAQ